jgi:hypothetical protein
LNALPSGGDSSRSRSSTDDLLFLLLLIRFASFRVFRAHSITTKANLMLVAISTPRVEAAID